MRQNVRYTAVHIQKHIYYTFNPNDDTENDVDDDSNNDDDMSNYCPEDDDDNYEQYLSELNHLPKEYL